MAYTTINKSSDYFNTKLYTGNDADNHAITGVGFQPYWLWIKQRGDAGYDHSLTDSVRGSTKMLYSDLSRAEDTHSTGVKSFDSDGFTLGTDDGSGGAYANLVNYTKNYVAWNWKANGAGSANTDGSINTTATSVNTTAGFSISKYTGNATSGATVGHGLGTTPSVIIVKKTSGSDGWVIYHHKNTSAPATEYLRLDTSDATADNLGEWNDTAPSSTVFTIGNSGRTNDNGATYIAYCFAEKTGYSKFGAYVGNGSTNGTFAYTGFKPAFVMVKYASPGGGVGNWGIFDSVRNPTNVVTQGLLANSTAAEDTSDFINIVSNGFKQKSASTNRNEDGSTYIYMAFAENPFVANVGGGLPTTAR